MGKSVFAVNLSLSLAEHGTHSVYFNLEMSTHEQAVRALFSRARLSVDKFKRCDMQPEDWNVMNLAATRLSNIPIEWDEACGLTAEQIEDRVKKLKKPATATNGVTAIVIDHVLLMRSTNTRAPRREQILHTTQRLKAIAKEHGIAVIAITQLSRECAKRGADRSPIL